MLSPDGYLSANALCIIHPMMFVPVDRSDTTFS
ncbi:MAG: hypothetical protein LZF62_240022 [Nitrospira sp.]|nr:MAG: hypothetical protein LZF62_240022 [Nitrospira sp.]